jgi:RNAse (barnase) inhibitor barstar
MTAFTNIPPHAVLPLGAYDLDELRRCARRADQRLLYVDLSDTANKAQVLDSLAKAFELPAHFGRNLDALYDCMTELKPLPDAEQPGFVVILKSMPGPELFSADDRNALLDVFRDTAEFFFDRDMAFRMFYSIRPRPSAAK